MNGRQASARNGVETRGAEALAPLREVARRALPS